MKTDDFKELVRESIREVLTENKAIDFKRLGGDEWIELRKTGYYTYSHEIRCDGQIIAIVPYIREGKDAWKLGIRTEVTPSWGRQVSHSALTGAVDKGEQPIESARRELLEEAGIDVDISKIESHGTCRGTKSTDTTYHLFSVDVTGLPIGEPTGDDYGGMEWMYLDDRVVDPIVYVIARRTGFL